MPSRHELAAFRELRRIVDQLEPRVRAEVEAALRALQRSISVQHLEQVIASRDAFAIHSLVATLPARLRPALALLERAMLSGAQTARQMLPPDVRMGFRLDATNPLAAQAAVEGRAAAIRGITTETQQALRAVIARGFTDGIAPRELARLIRPMIGLSELQAQAVAGRRLNLIAEGRSVRVTAAATESYALRLLQQRAMLIARTEVIRASTQGQLLAWREAVRAGYLRPQSQKAWMTTPDDRLCRFCRAMNNRQVALGAKFVTPKGLVDGPPLHPNCRCAVFVVPVAVPRAA